MSVLRLILSFLSFYMVTGVVAIHGPVEIFRSEVRTIKNDVSQLEERLSNLEYACFKKARGMALLTEEDSGTDEVLQQMMLQKFSGSEIERKVAELDRRIEEINTKVIDLGQQAERGLVAVKRDLKRMKAAMRNDRNAGVHVKKLRQIVHGYVNESLIGRGFERGHVTDVSRGQGCQVGERPRANGPLVQRPFAEPPKFMYGISKLDSEAVVRVEVKLLALGTGLAKIEIGTWNTKHLYGAYVRWMACP